MNQEILLLAFVTFVIVLLISVLILRQMSVRDIFPNSSSPFSSSASPAQNLSQKNISPSAKKQSASGTTSIDDKTFKFDRKAVNNLGKVLGAVGAIMIFAPLPESMTNISLGIAFLGYLLVRFSAPPKTTQKLTTTNPSTQKIRQLASKPEYQEAIKLLYSDLGDDKLITIDDKYRRAVAYLESKGVATPEARENLKLLAPYIKR